jgi:serine/alanine adding enzyme
MDFIQLKHDTFSKWNEYVIQHPKSEIYHLAEWSEVFREVYNYNPYFMIMQEEGKMRGILPLFHQKGLMKNILISGFSGLLTVEQNEIDFSLISYLKNLRQQVKAKDLILVNSQINGNDFYYSDENVRIMLKLPSNVELLWKSIGVKQRNIVRKAESHQLKHRIITPDDKDVDVFYRLYAENYRDLGTPVNSRKYFKTQLNFFKDHIKLLLVEFRGKMIGGMWLHHFRDQMSDPEAASLRKYFYTGVNDYMYFKAFEYAVEAGCTSFNMGRSQRGSGTYKYKKKWGEVMIENFPVTRMREFKTIGEQKKKYKIFISLWKSSPLFLTEAIGPQIRKHFHLE